MLNKTEESSKNLFDISFNKSYQKNAFITIWSFNRNYMS